MTLDNETQPAPAAPNRHWIGYIAPMTIFMLFTALVEPHFRSQFVPLYALKIVLVCASLFAFRYTWRDMRFDARVLPLADSRDRSQTP